MRIGNPWRYGTRHHAAVDEPEVEIGEASVDLDRPPDDARGHEHDGVLTRRERVEECPRRERADASAKELVDLCDDRLGNEQVASELRDERGCEPMRTLAPVGRGDERTRVRDNPQRTVTSSRRYRSAARPRSSGPSPEPT